VRASNGDGVWDREGIVYRITQQPFFYETAAFRILMIVAGCILLTGAYRFRLRQESARIRVRLEERVAERERIARDLHDTLLQSFQGALMMLHAAAGMIPHRPDEARRKIEAIIEEERQAVTEARDAVQGLRASAALTTNIAQAICRLGEQLAARAAEHGPAFSINVEGNTQEFRPAVAEEIYRIACEAIRNSFCHANASRIEVNLCYDQRQFQLLIRDNGKGISAEILKAGGRSGHHGLPGLRERAGLAGGKLELRSQPGAGTEIELSIPASHAYSKSRRGLLWKIAGRER
jgi:signal transduction histidine kinase